MQLLLSMILSVQVKPGKRSDKIERINDQWVISIRGRAKDNEANEYLVEYLSKLTGLATSCILVRRGLTSRFKQIDIDAPERYVLDKLEAAIR